MPDGRSNEQQNHGRLKERLQQFAPVLDLFTLQRRLLRLLGLLDGLGGRELSFEARHIDLLPEVQIFAKPNWCLAL